nr:hypothetical protein GCM10020092_036270 [Actinoplanes digitatis]
MTVTDWSVPPSAATTTGFTGDTPVAPLSGVTLSLTAAASSVSATGSTQPMPAPDARREEEQPAAPAAAAAAAMPSAPMMTLRR